MQYSNINNSVFRQFLISLDEVYLHQHIKTYFDDPKFLSGLLINETLHYKTLCNLFGLKYQKGYFVFMAQQLEQKFKQLDLIYNFEDLRKYALLQIYSNEQLINLLVVCTEEHNRLQFIENQELINQSIEKVAEEAYLSDQLTPVYQTMEVYAYNEHHFMVKRMLERAV
jgi:hypothetical protein